MAEQPTAKGGGANQHGPFEVRGISDPAPTLASQGIDKNLAKRAIGIGLSENPIIAGWRIVAMAVAIAQQSPLTNCPTEVIQVNAVIGEHRLDLGFERLRVERLDDVVVDAGLARGNHVLGL
jgi:hypothetical protein